jgi:hypothetical protein
VKDVIPVRILQHVAGGAGHEHLAHDRLILVPRQRDHAQRGVPLLEQARRLDAVHLGHAHVHEHDVRLQLGDEIERPASRLRLADHGEVPRVEQ